MTALETYRAKILALRAKNTQGVIPAKTDVNPFGGFVGSYPIRFKNAEDAPGVGFATPKTTPASRTLFRDYETRSTIDLRRCGAWIYAAHPSTEVLCCAYAVDAGPVQLWVPGDPVPPEFIEAARNPAWWVSAFNDLFERSIEQHITAPRYGWPVVPLERHRCTMAQTLAVALPGKLEKAAVALGLAHQKDMAGESLMKRMSKPRKARKGEDPAGIHWHDNLADRGRLHAYCMQDVRVERELCSKLPQLSEDEQRLWVLDAQINDRGFYTDGALISGAIHSAETAGSEVCAELVDITGGEVTSPNEVAKIRTWLAAHGYTLSSLTRNAVKDALKGDNLAPVVRRVIELRQAGAHAAPKKLVRFNGARSPDGRVRGVFRFHGASTGRWSSHGVQVHNLKRPQTKDLGAAIRAIANGEPVPLSVIGDMGRAIICAAPGHRLIGADFSGVESRLTAWVSGQQSKLDQWALFDRTGDLKDEPYYLIGLQLGVEEALARLIGKIADLAFGYMGGIGAWRTLGAIYSTAPASDDEIKQKRQLWRELHAKDGEVLVCAGSRRKRSYCEARHSGFS